MRKKQIVALCLSLVMVASVFLNGCGKQEQKESVSQGQAESKTEESKQTEESGYFNATGFPIVNEEITLKVVCCDNAKRTVEFEDMAFWKYFSELTGIKFEFEYYNGTDIYTMMPLIMSNPDDMPDLFLQCGIGASDLLSYGSQGLLMDMTDLIEKYGDNTKAIWEAHPEYRNFATASDGAVYGMPAYNYNGLPGGYGYLYVNSRWMKNCGITEIPKTTDELKEMLIKFRDMDANGNGDPNDEFPMMATQANFFSNLANYFGMPLDWPYTGAQYGALYGTTEAVPVFMLDNYRAMLEYWHELYEEKLINQDFFSVTKDESTARRLADRFGVLETYYANAEEKYDPNEFEIIYDLSSEYEQNPEEYLYLTPSYQTGMGAISAHTKYPEACMRVIDYFYSIDGTAAQSSANSKDYDLKAAGISEEIITMLDKALETYGDKTTAQANTFGCQPNRYSEPLAKVQYQTYANKLAEGRAEIQKSNVGKEFFNPTHTISYTEDELEVVNTYKTDIDGYVTETVAKWITGEVELNDTTWNAYIAQLKKMNVDKLTEANVSAHNRFFGVK